MICHGSRGRTFKERDTGGAGVAGLFSLARAAPFPWTLVFDVLDSDGVPAVSSSSSTVTPPPWGSSPSVSSAAPLPPSSPAPWSSPLGLLATGTSSTSWINSTRLLGLRCRPLLRVGLAVGAVGAAGG